MITFEEAYGTVMKFVFETESETIPFSDTWGRILDENIASDIDMPPFNRSAVDGYACNRIELTNDLDVIEVIPAGKNPLRTVGEKQCSKVMTGAIVPNGCDVVFMIEESEILHDGRIRFTGINPKQNISCKGEDVKRGDVVIKMGKRIQPQDIALMASVGHVSVRVKKRPVVGIISTGDELIDPSGYPAVSQIRNSNASQLAAQIKRAGGAAVDYGICPDNETVTFEIIEKSIKECEIVIITGGVSMGDFDFVPTVLEKAGVKIQFDRVKVQPGKPTTFGTHTKAVVFGLPGNPVSSFIQFELLVRPFINKMMGYTWTPLEYELPLGIDFERKSSDRLAFVPVTINMNKEVIPVNFHGSAHLAALTDADGIIALKPGIKSLKKGEIVNVRQI